MPEVVARAKPSAELERVFYYNCRDWPLSGEAFLNVSLFIAIIAVMNADISIVIFR
ncbi:hypothetical protein F5X97DRAFT_320154 [Nemania serpens]|nr:hypothetical protein F5X97DRAFT_320154 [Nemania serpens]